MLFTSTVSLNEIKKGTRVQLKNGLFGIIFDNNIQSKTRIVKVQSYAYDVSCRELKAAVIDGEWKAVRF